MNLCMKSTNVENDCIIIDNNLRCLSKLSVFQNSDDFQQNLNKLALPNSIVRSSSLSKISNSCQKKNSNNSSKKQHFSGNYNDAFSQNKSKKLLSELNGNVESSTKTAIVNKLFLKNQVSNKFNSNTKNKQNHNQKQKYQLPSDLFYHKHQNIDKLIKIYKEKSQKQLSECTFNPKIKVELSARNNDSKQFYKYQIQHTKRTQDKIQLMRELIKTEKQKQNTFRPKLSQQTIQLTHRRANANVYDRLYNMNNEKKCNQIGNTTEYQKLDRQVSKKSISLVSSRKKKNQISQSKEKDKKINSIENRNSSLQNKSKQLKRQTSIRTFQQIFHRKQSTSLNSNQKKQESNTLYSEQKKPNDPKRQSNENSLKKTNLQHNEIQLLDCCQLIQKKRHSNNLLSRQQTCKLMSSESNEMGKTERKYHGQKQWIRNKNSIILRNKISQKNQKIALEKFIKQFFIVICKMSLKKFIDFSQMVLLMKNMNFIENLDDFYQCKVDSQIKSKAFQIWAILEGIEGSDIDLMNLLKILCAIQGYNNALMIQQALKNISQTLNYDDLIWHKQEKRLILSEKDSKAIKKDMMNFYLTRFQLGESKMLSRQSPCNNFSFHPCISKESEEYADKYRERIISESQKLINEGLIDFIVPQNGMINHSTLLILDQKIKKYKIEQKRQESQREKRKKEEESMGHNQSVIRSANQTPMMEKHHKSTTKGEQELDSNVFSRILHNESQSKTKDQIFTQLYEQGRRSKSNRRDKSAQQIEYQQSKDQLTFKPKIRKNQIVSQFNQQSNLHDSIPNYTKEVMRMRKKKKTQKEELSLSPLLYLNVTMEGNTQTKIPVFQTDTLYQITEKVRVMMKIENGQEEKQKLSNILKEQIIPVLDHLGIRERDGRFFSGQ